MRVIIVGCGRLGSGLAQALSLQGQHVTVIDRDAAALGRLPASFRGPTVCGAALDRVALLQAGIERTDALAAVTHTDETNAVVARLAREVFRVPTVVARVNEQHKADIYRRLGLQTISTTAWGIHRIAELLVSSHLDRVGSIGNGGVELVEISLPAALAGRTPADLTLPGEALVVAITRSGVTTLAFSGAVFQERDVLHLAVTAGAEARVRHVLGTG
jgi:trk system potassium uptake protein TrkA